MNYEVRNQGKFTVVALSGEVDLNYSPEVRKPILQHLRAGRDVLVDLTDVSYIDSSGVATLVEGYQLARQSSREFGLVGVSEAAMRVLKLSRLDSILPMYDSAGERLGRG